MSDFLGPHGKASIILFTAHFEQELPKIRDLKKFLGIPDGKYYKRYGLHSYSIGKLIELMNRIYEFRNGNDAKRSGFVSDYLITVPDVEPNIFMTLKYSASIVEGFNLTTEAMTDLVERLQIYSIATSIHQSTQDIVSILENNQNRKLAGENNDISVLQPDLDGIRRLLDGYGSANLAASVRGLEDWYAKYRWQERKTSAPVPDTADAEVIEEVI